MAAVNFNFSEIPERLFGQDPGPPAYLAARWLFLRLTRPDIFLRILFTRIPGFVDSSAQTESCPRASISLKLRACWERDDSGTPQRCSGGGRATDFWMAVCIAGE